MYALYSFYQQNMWTYPSALPLVVRLLRKKRTKLSSVIHINGTWIIRDNIPWRKTCTLIFVRLPPIGAHVYVPESPIFALRINKYDVVHSPNILLMSIPPLADSVVISCVKLLRICLEQKSFCRTQSISKKLS